MWNSFRVGAPAVPVAHRVRWRETAEVGRLPGSPIAGSTGSGFEAVALCGKVFVLCLQLCQWHIECAGGSQSWQRTLHDSVHGIKSGRIVLCGAQVSCDGGSDGRTESRTPRQRQ